MINTFESIAEKYATFWDLSNGEKRYGYFNRDKSIRYIDSSLEAKVMFWNIDEKGIYLLDKNHIKLSHLPYIRSESETYNNERIYYRGPTIAGPRFEVCLVKYRYQLRSNLTYWTNYSDIQ